jgi:hypothetical protein
MIHSVLRTLARSAVIQAPTFSFVTQSVNSIRLITQFRLESLTCLTLQAAPRLHEAMSRFTHASKPRYAMEVKHIKHEKNDGEDQSHHENHQGPFKLALSAAIGEGTSGFFQYPHFFYQLYVICRNLI